MAKKTKKSMATATVTPSPSNTDSTTFPAVQAGRHPWFYFEDGTIILKVNYSKLQHDNSVLDFATFGRYKPPSSRFTDIF